MTTESNHDKEINSENLFSEFDHALINNKVIQSEINNRKYFWVLFSLQTILLIIFFPPIKAITADGVLIFGTFSELKIQNFSFDYPVLFSFLFYFSFTSIIIILIVDKSFKNTFSPANLDTNINSIKKATSFTKRLKALVRIIAYSIPIYLILVYSFSSVDFNSMEVIYWSGYLFSFSIATSLYYFFTPSISWNIKYPENNPISVILIKVIVIFPLLLNSLQNILSMRLWNNIYDTPAKYIVRSYLPINFPSFIIILIYIFYIVSFLFPLFNKKGKTLVELICKLKPKF